MKTQVSSWTVSVAAHLAVASALLFGLPFFSKPIVAEEKFQGIEVLLMASAPPVEAPPPPQPVVEHVPPPPLPEPVKEPEPITSNSTEPDVDPVSPPKPKPVVHKPLKPRPEPPRPQPEPVKTPQPPAPIVEPQPAKTQVAAVPPAPPGPATAAPRVTVDPAAEASYYASLLAWLERHKEYPRRAQLRRQEGVAHLRFTIDGQGRVIGHRIERSSGYETLDDAVERMIAKASPLPPIPATLGKNSLDVVVPIQFYLK